MSLPLLYQLQNASFNNLFKNDFKAAVVDMDDANLTALQVAELTGGQKKILFTYISIGEAEDYRSYWQDGGWNTSPPKFLLGENPDWEGNFLVKFWDKDWQKVMLARVEEAVKLGYNGMYLDIVDAYQVASVRNAYPGSDAALRKEMIDFVIALSTHAKAIDPNFMVVPQNAVGLVALDEDNPRGASNAAYLKAIDGMGVEDLWYDGNRSASWTKYDLEYIKLALDAGKFVLAASYPTDDAKQADFIDQAIKAGLIPFVADRNLTGVIDPINDTIDAKMAGKEINFPTVDDGGGISGDAPGNRVGESDEGVTIDGASGADNTTGGRGDDVIRGLGGNDWINGGDGNDEIYGGGGRDTIYGGAGDDKLRGGGGHDVIYGGPGNDDIKGGSGADIFVYTGGDGDDRLRAFEKGVDRIDLSGLGSINFRALDTNGNRVLDSGDAYVNVVNSKSIIDLAGAADADADSTLQVYGVTALTASDFIF